MRVVAKTETVNREGQKSTVYRHRSRKRQPALSETSPGTASVRQESEALPLARIASLILTSLAAGLLAYSYASMTLDIGPLGLAHSFPVTFYLSIGALALSSMLLFRSRERATVLVWVQLGLLITALTLTPLLLEGLPRERLSYRNMGWAIYAQEHTFDPGVAVGHNWPGFFAWSAVVSAVAGEGALIDLAALYPYLMQLAVLPLLIVIFRGRDFTGKYPNLYSAGLWVFYLANWSVQSYFAPASQGLMLYITFLAVTLLLLKPTDPGKRFTALLVAMAAIATHLLSSLALVIVSVMALAARRLRTAHRGESSGVTLAGVALILAVLISWTLFVTVQWFESNVKDLVSEAGKLDLIFGQNMQARVRGSDEHLVAVWLRILLSGAFLALGGLGLLLAFRTLLERIWDRIMASAWLGVSLSVAIISPYGGESFERLFLFSLPFAGYFACRVVRGRLWPLFAVVVLLAIPTHFVARYGNEGLSYVSPQQIAAVRFLDEGSREGTIVSPYWLVPFEDSSDVERFSWDLPGGASKFDWLSSDRQERQELLLAEAPPPTRRDYVLMDAGSRWLYESLYDEDTDSVVGALNGSPIHERIYDNADVEIWLRASD